MQSLSCTFVILLDTNWCKKLAVLLERDLGEVETWFYFFYAEAS